MVARKLFMLVRDAAGQRAEALQFFRLKVFVPFPASALQLASGW